jgi:hypothetical protein
MNLSVIFALRGLVEGKMLMSIYGIAKAGDIRKYGLIKASLMYADKKSEGLKIWS